MLKHVAVVDRDDINRCGIANLLAGHPGIEKIEALTHVQALGWSTEWRLVDILLINPVDEQAPDDRFPGVRVIESARRCGLPKQTPVIAITTLASDSALLRRASEAGTDYIYARSELGGGQRLNEVVLQPDAVRATARLPRNLELERSLGVTAASRVNRGVSYAIANGFVDALAGRTQVTTRSWQRLRREFNREARLSVITADGRPPERMQVPSRPQIARFLAWATGDARSF